MIAKPRATIEDLYRVPGKAELVNGEIVQMPPTGDGPGSAATNLVVSLALYARQSGIGRAYSDGVGYRVRLPKRDSLSPDASYYTGPRTGMKFLEGAPDFAVEVRSEGDYGPQAESDMAAKRADYFSAGTKVVWDVDLLGADVVRVYRASDQAHPAHPTIYRRGEVAEAEPAVPGWIFAVDELFE